MHNLHIITINDEDGKSACLSAESYMVDWGTENNWRHAIIAISEKNEIYVKDDEDSRGWDISTDPTMSVKTVNEIIKGWVDRYEITDLREIYATMKKILSKKKVKEMEYWSLHNWAHHMSNTCRLPKKLNVFKDTFNEGLYDKMGVTSALNDTDEKKWVVFMDVHS